MADCKPYYCYDFDAYPTDSSCDTQDYYLSGISAIGLLRCGTTITDPSDAVEVQALITSGAMVIVKGITAGVDEPSAVTIDALTGCGGTLTINYDRTATFTDGKVSQEVVEWYNTIKGNKFGGALLYECGEDRVSYITNEVSLNAARSMEQGNKAAQVIIGGLSWSGLNDPVPYPAPTGIFSTT